MIGYAKPKLITVNESDLVVRLPLNRRTRNHLNSMYFGALAVGADIAGGLHGFYHAQRLNKKVSLAFKSFQAQFIRRPETAVYFVSDQGEMVKQMILDSDKTGQRINKMMPIKAYVNYPNAPELVAEFALELSVKVV